MPKADELSETFPLAFVVVLHQIWLCVFVLIPAFALYESGDGFLIRIGWSLLALFELAPTVFSFGITTGLELPEIKKRLA